MEIFSDGLDLEAMLDQIEHRHLQMALARTGGVRCGVLPLLTVVRAIRHKRAILYPLPL